MTRGPTRVVVGLRLWPVSAWNGNSATHGARLSLPRRARASGGRRIVRFATVFTIAGGGGVHWSGIGLRWVSLPGWFRFRGILTPGDLGEELVLPFFAEIVGFVILRARRCEDRRLGGLVVETVVVIE